jgi:hypothetical protein
MNLRMKSSRRIDQQDINATAFGGLHAIINHGGGIGAGPMFDQIDADALRPRFELLDGGGTKGVRGHQKDFLSG